MGETAPYPVSGQFPPNNETAIDLVSGDPLGEGGSYCGSGVDTPIGLLTCSRPYFHPVDMDGDPMTGFRIIIEE